MINHAVFGLAAFRTPTSVRYAAPDRPIERGPVGASLSAGDYFAQYRLDHFHPEIFCPPLVMIWRQPLEAPALWAAMVVISRFYRHPRRWRRMGLLSTIASVSSWTTKAVPSAGASKGSADLICAYASS